MLEIFFKSKKAKAKLREMVNTMVKPMILDQRADYLTQLNDDEHDIALVLRSNGTEMFYFITTVRNDTAQGRILDNGLLDELIKF
jgi:hypothetical protein